MATPEREGSALSTSGIITVAILLVGLIVVSQFPLDVRRPDVTEKVPTVFPGIQNVEARLWQDPFAAVERHCQERSMARSRLDDPTVSQDEQRLHMPKGLADDLNARLQNHGAVVVLVVMVLGGPYIEDAEHRRRTRYAVLSGLNKEGFVPDNDDHIGYVVLPSEDSLSKTQHLPKVIPFKWLYFLTGAYTAWCVFLLRRAAESARRVALDSLTAHIIHATQQGAASAPYVGQLQLLKDEIESFRKGVFVSVSQQPIVRAVLIPMSTAIIPIIEYFSMR